MLGTAITVGVAVGGSGGTVGTAVTGDVGSAGGGVVSRVVAVGVDVAAGAGTFANASGRAGVQPASTTSTNNPNNALRRYRFIRECFLDRFTDVDDTNPPVRNK